MATRISKSDMKGRAAIAADQAPGLSERLRVATELVGQHPLGHDAQPALVAVDSPRSESGRQPPRLESVPLGLLDENPYNARKIYRPERVAELRSSIDAVGQAQPGIGVRRNGRIIVVAGHYRWRAIRSTNLKTMDLMVHEHLSDRELFQLSYHENAEREQQSALDNAMAWRALLDDGVYASETDIAEATRMSLSNVNKTLSILKLSPQVLALVADSPVQFAMTSLYELVLFEKEGGPEAALDLARRVAANDAGRKEIEEARAKLGKTRKRKEISRQYKLEQASGVPGSLKEWDSGRVSLDIVLTDAKERAEVVAELLERFKKKA